MIIQFPSGNRDDFSKNSSLRSSKVGDRLKQSKSNVYTRKLLQDSVPEGNYISTVVKATEYQDKIDPNSTYQYFIYHLKRINTQVAEEFDVKFYYYNGKPQTIELELTLQEYGLSGVDWTDLVNLQEMVTIEYDLSSEYGYMRNRKLLALPPNLKNSDINISHSSMNTESDEELPF